MRRGGRTEWVVERVRSTVWLVPGAVIAVAIVLGLALPELEERIGGEPAFLFEAGPDGARVMLSMIAGSALTLTVLVFSITIVALQLASSQFSPRVLRNFLRDWYGQLALGTFAATFAYSLTVLRAVRSDEAGIVAFVPRLSVFLAFGWALVSLLVFVLYVAHTAGSIRVVAIITRVGAETRLAIDRVFPTAAEPEPAEGAKPSSAPAGCAGDSILVAARRGGYLVRVDLRRLAAWAARTGVVVEVVPAVGDFVPRGAPLLRLHPDDEEPTQSFDPSALVATVRLAPERSVWIDVAFGFRQLVDIAEKALSPAVNDSTTAVQALNVLHDLLRSLARRPWPSGIVAGPDGRPRVVVHHPGWDDLVHLAIDEIRQFGAGAVSVDRQLRRMLADLLAVAPLDRRRELEVELRLVRSGAERSFVEAVDRARALG